MHAGATGTTLAHTPAVTAALATLTILAAMPALMPLPPATAVISGLLVIAIASWWRRVVVVVGLGHLLHVRRTIGRCIFCIGDTAHDRKRRNAQKQISQHYQNSTVTPAWGSGQLNNGRDAGTNPSSATLNVIFRI